MAEPTNVTCSAACTVSVVIQPEPLTVERVQADLVVFGAVLGYLAVVWGAKEVYNRFRTGRYES